VHGRRFVRIQQNWRNGCSLTELSGSVTPPDYRELLTAREKSQLLKMAQNALRHGFASYHLARFNDAACAALDTGHASAHLVFQHYRQLVKPKQARALLDDRACCNGKRVIKFAAA